ncbi:MAG: thioredoxin family protein [Oscillospiraceae bacterium]|nr:thioredoxin family protein [Oscillospiraceae bacterium]
MLFHTSQRDFFEVLEISQEMPVLVDFYAPWCAPCRALEPKLDQLSEDYPDQVIAYSVNTDTDPELAQEYAVENLPCVILFRNGKPVKRWEKNISVEEIEQVIRNQ